MEIYIVDGRELTLEQFEALAKEAGLNTEQYKALYNVEVKQDPNALDGCGRGQSILIFGITIGKYLHGS